MCEKYRVSGWQNRMVLFEEKFDENIIINSKIFVEQMKPKIFFPQHHKLIAFLSDFFGDTYRIKCNKYSTCVFTYQNVLFRKSNDTLSLTSSK